MDDHELTEAIDGIDRVLEDGDPGRALALAVRALRRSAEPDPLLHFLAGRASLDLDRPDDAVLHLERATELDPDDVDYRAELAAALFRSCRFDDAGARNDEVLRAEPDRPDALELAGMILEREGLLEEADRRFRAARRLDPDRFSRLVRLDRDAFEEVVRRAADRLPEPFRNHLDDVVVSVEPLPSDEVLLETETPLDPSLLGLFVGTSLLDRSHLGPGGDLPPRVLLFQRNLERYATDREDLEEQIAITVYHELGHYLGLDEDELIDIDLG